MRSTAASRYRGLVARPFHYLYWGIRGRAPVSGWFHGLVRDHARAFSARAWRRGGFLAAVGLGIVVGAFGSSRWRTVSLIAGAALGVDFRWFWAIDGLLKIAAGVVMVLVSYV